MLRYCHGYSSLFLGLYSNIIFSIRTFLTTLACKHFISTFPAWSSSNIPYIALICLTFSLSSTGMYASWKQRLFNFFVVSVSLQLEQCLVHSWHLINISWRNHLKAHIRCLSQVFPHISSMPSAFSTLISFLQSGPAIVMPGPSRCPPWACSALLFSFPCTVMPISYFQTWMKHHHTWDMIWHSDWPSNERNDATQKEREVNSFLVMNFESQEVRVGRDVQQLHTPSSSLPQLLSDLNSPCSLCGDILCAGQTYLPSNSQGLFVASSEARASAVTHHITLLHITLCFFSLPTPYSHPISSPWVCIFQISCQDSNPCLRLFSEEPGLRQSLWSFYSFGLKGQTTLTTSEVRRRWYELYHWSQPEPGLHPKSTIF